MDVGEEGGSNRASSAAESPSPPPQRESSDEGRGSGGEESDLEDEKCDIASDRSGSVDKNDTDSSYD